MGKETEVKPELEIKPEKRSKISLFGFKAEFINQSPWLVIVVIALGLLTLIIIVYLLKSDMAVDKLIKIKVASLINLFNNKSP